MDMSELFNALGNVAPPVASLAIMAWIGWKVIEFLFNTNKETVQMFHKHGEALKVVSDNMQANTEIVHKMSNNVEQNTKAMEQMVKALEKKSK